MGGTVCLWSTEAIEMDGMDGFLFLEYNRYGLNCWRAAALCCLVVSPRPMEILKVSRSAEVRLAVRYRYICMYFELVVKVCTGMYVWMYRQLPLYRAAEDAPMTPGGVKKE